MVTLSTVFSRLADKMDTLRQPAFDCAVVDESQDISPQQLRFLASMARTDGHPRANALFFTGDLGQRIFQQPFSWKSLGVEVRGRSRTLRINYRTSHQIRQRADRLLGPEVSDPDGNTESRKGTVSVFNGPQPEVKRFGSIQAEIDAVAAWLRAQAAAGIAPHEMAIFVRSDGQIDRAVQAARLADIPSLVLDDRVEVRSGHLAVCTMHRAKGLEFRAVVVMACDDEVIPLQERIETAADESELEEVFHTERHLLYVACTRARDHLLVCCGGDASEFLGDL